MKHLVLTVCALLAPAPASADVAGAIEDHILPALATFQDAASALDSAARADCLAASLKPAYHAAFDAWMQVADLHIGPSESAAHGIAFWPDTKGFIPRTLSSLIDNADPVVDDADSFHEVSIAARGLFALDRLLYDNNFSEYNSTDYTCKLTQAISHDLHRQAMALHSGWQQFAITLTTAGDPGNATFLAPAEASRALYTQMIGGLEFTADTRLGRPLGTFDRPRPARAEAWRSARSLRNAVQAVDAARRLAHGLADVDLPLTDAAVDKLHRAAERIKDPGFQDILDPQQRLHLEVLQQAVQAVETAVTQEIGQPLGITPGFNAQDGD